MAVDTLESFESGMYLQVSSKSISSILLLICCSSTLSHLNRVLLAAALDHSRSALVVRTRKRGTPRLSSKAFELPLKMA